MPTPAHRAAPRDRACFWAGVAVLLAGALHVSASAQPIERPADERPELPPFEAPTEPEPILPPVAPAPRAQLSSGPGVAVAGYRVVGSTVFSDEELQRAVAPWRGRRIRSEDLVSVRNAITELYLREGYINSGATLPDQDLVDGIVEIRIVEGSLGEIRVSGNRQFRSVYLRSRIRRGAGTPLDVGELQREIQLLQLDPGIRRVSARLFPGDRLGEAVLSLEVEEGDRLRVEARFGNHEPPSIGSLSGEFEGVVANVAGTGDRLRGQFSIADGLKRYRGRYEIPVTPWGTELSLDARYSTSEVVEEPFDALDIESTFQSYQVGLAQPVYTTPATQVEVGVIGDWRQSQTDLLGSAFSFSGSGARRGRTTAAVLRFFGDWLRRDQRQVLAARLQVSWGIDALNATRDADQTFPEEDPNNRLPNARFVSGLLQLQWARRLAYGIEALFRTDLQLASDPLFTMERIAVGGHATVRGYRENQRVKDQGVVGSIEVRLPVWRERERFGLIQLAPFVDVGHVWDHRAVLDDRKDTLVSAGVGLRWTLPRLLSAELYWGQNLTHVETSSDPQDDGIHFEIRARLP